MINNIFLSVIVPVYNAEKYLKDCIESILKQTYNDFEIILVDDGSTDGSGKICDEYAKKDDRITVIHSANQGILLARKLGVASAKGQLVTFVDADDWIDNNTYETVIEIMKKHEIDMFCYTFSCDGYIEKQLYEERSYTKKEIHHTIVNSMMYDIGLNNRRLNPSLGCKIMKRELFEKIADIVDKRISFGEDALITYPAVFLAERIYICNEPFYHYRKNLESCMHTFPISRVTELMNFQTCIKEVFGTIGVLNEMEEQIYFYMRPFLKQLLANWYNIGFSVVKYTFPFHKILPNKKIVVYGAGAVGKSYVYELMRRNYAEIVGLIDKNYESIKYYCGINVVGICEINKMSFDYVLIAIQKKEIADEVIEELVNIGIDESKIIWEKPKAINMC